MGLSEPEPAQEIAAPVESPTLSLSTAPGGLLDRIPLYLKIGVALLLVVAIYFAVAPSKTAAKPAQAASTKPISVGGQGWSTLDASDTAGSRRGRKITLYQPSSGLSDYRFQFIGRIENNALGWVFRASDPKNYYGAKIQSPRPGTVSIARFAVVDGRESSVNEKPIPASSTPGAQYKVKLDASGNRFTISVDGETVDSWTDNRLASGAVGFMNERDERGSASAVNFSFPQAGGGR